MAHTIETAFDHQYVDQVLRFVSEYRFRLGTLESEITIRIFRTLDSKSYLFEQSHYISTPVQATPYITSRPWNDSEAAAINQVVGAMNDYYSEAVNKRHTPAESWLTTNEHFLK
jgi:hypothetical protein